MAQGSDGSDDLDGLSRESSIHYYCVSDRCPCDYQCPAFDIAVNNHPSNHRHTASYDSRGV